jgi:L-cystine uptake protein TcyP (sodium:dicarboxylate symporter family)
MKSLTVIGLVLLGISSFLYYLTTDFTVEKLSLPHIMGIMAGIGIGLIIGGLVGYVSKGTAMKNEQKRKELSTLKKEKEALEKQMANEKKPENTF